MQSEDQKKRWHEAYLKTAEKRRADQKKKYADNKEYWRNYYKNNPEKYHKNKVD